MTGRKWQRIGKLRLALLAPCLGLLGAGVLLLTRQDMSWAALGQELGQRWPFTQREVEIRFEGRIDAKKGDVWHVAGQQCQVPAVALEPRPAAAFPIGAWVVVRAVRQTDGSLVARSVTFDEGRDPLGEAIEFVGVIAELPTDSLYGTWCIDEIAVEVNAGTSLWPQDCQPRVGERAEIKAIHRLTGPLLAQSIAFSPLGQGTLVEFEGEISQLPAGDSTSGLWRVGDVEVIVEAKAMISGLPRLGAHAEVSGFEEQAHRVRALEIRVSGPAERQVILRGAIVDLGDKPGIWTLSSQEAKGEKIAYKIRVDERTFIDESRGVIAVNRWAEIRATRKDDGSLRAEYIRMERP